MSTWEMRLKSESFQRVLWPFVALMAILVFNLLFTPGFFHIEVKTNFELTESSLSRLQASMPEEVFTELSKLKNNDYTDEKNFLDIVGDTIGKDELAKYRSVILQHHVVDDRHDARVCHRWH